MPSGCHAGTCLCASSPPRFSLNPGTTQFQGNSSCMVVQAADVGRLAMHPYHVQASRKMYVLSDVRRIGGCGSIERKRHRLSAVARWKCRGGR